MKFLKILGLLVVCLYGWNAQAVNLATDSLSVDRFTDMGGGIVRWEQGSLFVKQGFIPSTSSEDAFNMTYFEYPAGSRRYFWKIRNWFVRMDKFLKYCKWSISKELFSFC